jgi:small-conductance mechanosensitive channel/CRP-like cAMP-binding protein
MGHGAMGISFRELALSVAALAVLLVAVSALVRRFASERAVHLRKPSGLFATFALLSVLYVGAHALELSAAARWLAVSVRVVGGLTAVSLAALAILDVLARVLGRLVPTIVIDLVSAAGYAVVVGLALADSGINPTSAIAGTTVVAAVLTVSLQSTLGNVVGGVALQIDGSVHVGDWVQLDGGRVGCVSAVRWRHVVLDTRDGDAIVVPNSVLLAQPFTVLARRNGDLHPHRQTVHFRVDFRFDPAHVCGVVAQALRAAPIVDVASDPPPHCVCLELARGDEGSALYAARYFLTDLWRDAPVDSDVRARIHAALRRAEIPLAVPVITNLNTSAPTSQSRRAAQVARAYEALRALGLFASLSDDECRTLASSVAYAPFAPGELITRQGAVAEHLFLVTGGVVEVRSQSEGRDPQAWEISAPGFFGEMGLLTGEPRRASVFAKGSVECFKLERRGLEEVVRRRPAVAVELGEALAERQAQLAASASIAPSRVERPTAAGLASAIRRLFGV